VSARLRAAGQRLVTLAVRGRRARGGPWGEALLAEFDEVRGTREALRWTLGGLRVAWRERRARFAALPRRTRLRHHVTRLVVAAVLLAIPVRLFAATIVYEPSAAMDPSVRIGGRVLVDRVSFHLTGLHHGDIVLVRLNDWEGHPARGLTRVIGLPGDRISCADGAVHRDGTALAEPYLAAGTRTDCTATTVGTGQLYLLSDNRDRARDSRAYGPVAAGAVQGRVLGPSWPDHL
jgi:signal peptidase I